MDKRVLIKSERVFDGQDFIGKKEILVENGIITKVGNRIQCDNVVDLEDLFVSPGFVDSHIHFSGFNFSTVPQSFLYETNEMRLLRNIPELKKILNAGFTTVRGCGDNNDVFIRNAIREGYIEGPNIIAAGNALGQTFGHGELSHTFPAGLSSGYFGIICDGVPECIKAARSVLRTGADFIKILTSGGVVSQRDDPNREQFTLSEVKAITHEAKKAGTYVAAHAYGDRGIKLAIKGGVSFIEHGALATQDSIKLMSENNITLTPTLSVFALLDELSRQGKVPSSTADKLAPVMDHAGSVVRMARKAGVNILTGTDLIGPTGSKLDYGSNWREIILLSEIGGLSSIEALRAATGNSVVLGKKIGNLKPGFNADIIGINGSPLENINDVSKVDTVMKMGIFVKGKNAVF